MFTTKQTLGWSTMHSHFLLESFFNSRYNLSYRKIIVELLYNWSSAICLAHCCHKSFWFPSHASSHLIVNIQTYKQPENLHHLFPVSFPQHELQLDFRTVMQYGTINYYFTCCVRMLPPHGLFQFFSSFRISPSLFGRLPVSVSVSLSVSVSTSLSVSACFSLSLLFLYPSTLIFLVCLFLLLSKTWHWHVTTPPDDMAI